MTETTERDVTNLSSRLTDGVVINFEGRLCTITELPNRSYVFLDDEEDGLTMPARPLARMILSGDFDVHMVDPEPVVESDTTR